MKKKILLTVKKEDLHLLNEYDEFDLINIEDDLISGGKLPDYQDIGSSLVLTNKKIIVTLKLKSDTYQLKESDKEQLLHLLEMLNMVNVWGIKWSSLNESGSIDKDYLNWIIQNKGNLKLIYGRAIDSARDYQEAVMTLKEYKDDIEYITTSGGAEAAIDGLYNIEFASMKLPNKVIAGSRVDLKNINKFINSEVEGIHMYKGIHDQDGTDLKLSIDKIEELIKLNS